MSSPEQPIAHASQENLDALKANLRQRQLLNSIAGDAQSTTEALDAVDNFSAYLDARYGEDETDTVGSEGIDELFATSKDAQAEFDDMTPSEVLAATKEGIREARATGDKTREDDFTTHFMEAFTEKYTLSGDYSEEEQDNILDRYIELLDKPPSEDEAESDDTDTTLRGSTTVGDVLADRADDGSESDETEGVPPVPGGVEGEELPYNPEDLLHFNYSSWDGYEVFINSASVNESSFGLRHRNKLTEATTELKQQLNDITEHNVAVLEAAGIPSEEIEAAKEYLEAEFAVRMAIDIAKRKSERAVEFATESKFGGVVDTVANMSTTKKIAVLGGVGVAGAVAIGSAPISTTLAVIGAGAARVGKTGFNFLTRRHRKNTSLINNPNIPEGVQSIADKVAEQENGFLDAIDSTLQLRKSAENKDSAKAITLTAGTTLLGGLAAEYAMDNLDRAVEWAVDSVPDSVKERIGSFAVNVANIKDTLSSAFGGHVSAEGAKEEVSPKEPTEAASGTGATEGSEAATEPIPDESTDQDSSNSGSQESDSDTELPLGEEDLQPQGVDEAIEAKPFKDFVAKGDGITDSLRDMIAVDELTIPDGSELFAMYQAHIEAIVEANGSSMAEVIAGEDPSGLFYFDSASGEVRLSNPGSNLVIPAGVREAILAELTKAA